MLASGVASQGLTVAAAVFRAEVAAATTASDTTSAAAFNLRIAAIENSVDYPGRSVGCATPDDNQQA
jgi:hypothetical protein